MFQDEGNSQWRWRQLRGKQGNSQIKLKITDKHIKISFKGKFGVWGRSTAGVI